MKMQNAEDGVNRSKQRKRKGKIAKRGRLADKPEEPLAALKSTGMRQIGTVSFW